MECENAIITAVSDGGRQFGRGERGGTVPGMFIESSARRGQGNKEREDGEWIERIKRRWRGAGWGERDKD
ncbi:hypothetical protein PBY51_016927 [Eleginops maclovinus]|uniref:Uncharacterized protein n=1 Tax=Eleginops maclovinus TaxID=56733 RepID=A0AAN8A007_ELEMC|nr:hypothetical protein PBY51_016927 [Eleginops maclovinus]